MNVGKKIGYYGSRAIGAAGGLITHGTIDGAYRGYKIGEAFSKAVGFGAYSVTKNSLSEHTVAQVPVMHSSGEAFRITNREFLCDITGTEGFFNREFYLNPGNDVTFPWLSRVAANFQQYEIMGCMVHYRPTSSSVNPSGGSVALGTVIMTANYNCTEPPFTNKPEMEANVWTISGRPSDAMTLPIECASHMSTLTDLYVRNGAVPGGTDPHFYDFATVQIATSGTSAAATLGELWITYDIVLIKPIIKNDVNTVLQDAHWVGSHPVSVNMDTPFEAAAAHCDTIGLTFTGQKIFFPSATKGRFLINYVARKSGEPTQTNDPTINVSGGTLIPIEDGAPGFAASRWLTPDAGVLANAASVQFIVDIPDPRIVCSVQMYGMCLCETWAVIVSRVRTSLNAKPRVAVAHVSSNASGASAGAAARYVPPPQPAASPEPSLVDDVVQGGGEVDDVEEEKVPLSSHRNEILSSSRTKVVKP